MLVGPGSVFRGIAASARGLERQHGVYSESGNEKERSVHNGSPSYKRPAWRVAMTVAELCAVVAFALAVTAVAVLLSLIVGGFFG